MEEMKQITQQQQQALQQLQQQLTETQARVVQTEQIRQQEVSRLIAAQETLTEQLARSLPQTGQRAPASLIDTRGIRRPSSFTSDRKLWPIWAFRFSNFLEGALAGSTKALNWSADEVVEIDDSKDSDDMDKLRVIMDGMSTDELNKFSKQLYSALAQLTEGESNDIVRIV